MRGFGRREFQLVLLRRMSDYDRVRVQDALAGLGLRPADALAAHVRWQRMLRSGRFAADERGYRAVLGPPDLESTVDTSFGPLAARCWTLPDLWPGLCWQLLSDPDGTGSYGELTRWPGTPPVPVPARPEPWSLVVSDVLADPAVRVDGRVDGTVPGRTVVPLRRADGRAQRLSFSWGLLQRAD